MGIEGGSERKKEREERGQRDHFQKETDKCIEQEQMRQLPSSWFRVFLKAGYISVFEFY